MLKDLFIALIATIFGIAPGTFGDKIEIPPTEPQVNITLSPQSHTPTIRPTKSPEHNNPDNENRKPEPTKVHDSPHSNTPIPTKTPHPTHTITPTPSPIPQLTQTPSPTPTYIILPPITIIPIDPEPTCPPSPLPINLPHTDNIHMDLREPIYCLH